MKRAKIIGGPSRAINTLPSSERTTNNIVHINGGSVAMITTLPGSLCGRVHLTSTRWRDVLEDSLRWATPSSFLESIYLADLRWLSGDSHNIHQVRSADHQSPRGARIECETPTWKGRWVIGNKQGTSSKPDYAEVNEQYWCIHSFALTQYTYE